jgi:hypothetical protein
LKLAWTLKDTLRIDKIVYKGAKVKMLVFRLAPAEEECPLTPVDKKWTASVQR